MTFSDQKRTVPVLIVRHAPSVWNAEGRWQGRADPMLSGAGEAMAAAASARVGHVDLVITSGLTRAVRTGQLLAPGAQEVIEEGLGEYDLGSWSGLTRPEIARRWPEELAAFDVGQLDSAPGGETRDAFDRRISVATDVIVAVIETYEPASVLVVTHAGVIRAMCRLRGDVDRHVGHLCGYEAAVKEGTLSLGSPICLLDPVGATEERDEPQAL